MNTTLRRIALSAPVAITLVGFGLSSAQAAPYQPGLSDSVNVQPVADKPDVVINPDWDFDPQIGPDDISDTPDDPVVDPAPPEPSDNDDSDDDSDDNSDQNTNTGGKGTATVAPRPDASNETAADEVKEADTTEAVDVATVAEVDKPFPFGLVALIAGGILLGVAAWVSYRAGNKTA